MGKPPPVVVVLGRSRLAALLVAMIAVASGAIVAALPWPLWLATTAIAGIAGWAGARLRIDAWRSARQAAIEVLLGVDRRIVIRTRQGASRAGLVRPTTYVSPSLTAIVWKADGERLSRTLLVLPDMLPSEDFRRLRVVLLHGSSEVVAGASASQA